MFRLVKWLIVIVFVLGLIYGASYAGSYLAAGKVVGPNPTFMGTRKTVLNLKGVEELAGSPPVWVHTYGPTQIPGVQSATIYVTLRGKVISTRPRNLAERVRIFRDRNP